MLNSPLGDLLKRLASPEAHEAWRFFIEEYGGLIFKVVKHFEADSEEAADCFQFVCEQLVKDSFRRLRRFECDGPAAFTTWLRAVVRNLCLDWHRKQHGRVRIFRSVQRLSSLDQEIFRQIYEQGHTDDEAFENLGSRFPALTRTDVSESVERINRNLSASQIATLRRRSRVGSSNIENETSLVDERPNPEELAIDNETRAKVLCALDRLPKEKRLLLRLRFEEALTLGEIARLLDLGNAQRADREVKQALSLLREEINSIRPSEASGKDVRSSVKVEWKESV